MAITHNTPISRQTLYQVASIHSKAAIARLAELMNSSNENVALGACKIILNKVIPDLKSESVEIETRQIRVIMEKYEDGK